MSESVDSEMFAATSLHGRVLIGSGVAPLARDGRNRLDWLLSPLTADGFLSTFWAKEHIHLRRGDAEYFAHVWTLEEIETHLRFGRHDPALMRLVKAGVDRPIDEFLSPDGRLDLIYLRNAFAEGYTIVFNGLDRSVESVSSLMRQIETEWNFEAMANVYVTPPNAQGFLPHFDDHDVLVLQLQGFKEWQVYPEADVPAHQLFMRPHSVTDGLPEPKKIPLAAGDVLYIPRGRVHAASTSASLSVHLTIGIQAPSVMTLLTKTLENIGYRNDLLFSRLPPRHLSERGVRDQLRQMVDRVLALVDEQAVADGIGALEDKLVRRGKYQSAGTVVCRPSDVKALELRTFLERSPFTLSRVLEFEDSIALQFEESIINASRDFRDALLFIAQCDRPFTVDELPNLTDDEKVSICRALTRDGLLIRSK